MTTPLHPDTCPSEAALEALRRRLDDIDADLLDALNRRAVLSREIGALKADADAPVLRPDREAALLARLEAGTGPLPAGHLRAIYREILAASRALQRPLSVACLGPEGTFSSIACQEYFGHGLRCRPLPQLADVFAAVQRRECDYGLVPIENSLNGTVGPTCDLFAEHEAYIQAEWYSRIQLSLLSRETSLSAVDTVCSHPQPLGQAANWLRAHVPGARQLSLESTAVAAQRAAEQPGCASIGHAGLAERLGLNVLERNIEDQPDNWTRFFVIAAAPLPVDTAVPAKTSVTFCLPDEPGALCRVLNVFTRSGVNMSKLESRPMHRVPWRYRFFADLTAPPAALETALAETTPLCLEWRVLGTYPEEQRRRV